MSRRRKRKWELDDTVGAIVVALILGLAWFFASIHEAGVICD